MEARIDRYIADLRNREDEDDEDDVTEKSTILINVKKRKILQEKEEKEKQKIARLQKRKQINNEMKNISQSSKFGDYVITKICDFKEELRRLETQNNYVLQMNAKLKLENEVLHETLDEKDERLKEVITFLGNKVCYKCFHNSSCDKLRKCSHCENKFCNCCHTSCQKKTEKGYKCYKSMCKDCAQLHGFCKDCIS